MLFLNGIWTSGSGGKDDVLNPCDGSVIEQVDVAGPDDVDAAVVAARNALDDWARTPIRERAGLLTRVAGLLTRDKDEIARLETLDTGKTLVESGLDVDDVIAVFRYYAGLAASDDAGRLVDTGQATVVSRIVYEPVGVCALITPWNYPLLQISWKVAPALAAGNTVVIKPSEVTPLTTIRLVALLAEAGAPDGVVNLVLGAGGVGGALVEHPGVDLVSFTGGVATGKRILRAAAETVKRVTVELGGKNPNIVFADSDFETVVDHALTAVFLHSGQVCSAGARLLVEEPLHDALVAEVAARAERIVVGNGLDPASETGPLVSAAHREKVAAYVASGLAEGAVLLAGGRPPDDPALANGYFYRPTVFDGCHAGMRIVREETFGPLLTVETFTSEDEALALANNTEYGLAGAVWTTDAGRAERVARGLRAGTVWINDYHPYVPQAEWGGVKQSGNGRELGPSGLAEYREAKHIWQNTAPAPARWFKG